MSVSVKVLASPPEPPVPGTSDAWAVMEAHLATAKVHDLLDESSARLTRLANEVSLPDAVVERLRETLRLVEAGRQTIGQARHELPSPRGADRAARTGAGRAAAARDDEAADREAADREAAAAEPASAVADPA